MAVADRLDEIVADIVADVPGATEADIRIELARKCREFCQRSRCWRIVCSVRHIAGGTTLVNIGDVDDDARVWTLDRLWVGNLPAERRRLRYNLATGPEGRDAIYLDRSPEASGEFDLVMAATMQPSTNYAMPEWIYELYGTALAAGVVARLKQRVRRPYSDPQGWVEFDRAWRRGIADAAARRQAEYSDVVHRVIDPTGSAWTVEDGDVRRDVASVPTYRELVGIVRTLCQDLRDRGYLPREDEV